MHMHFFYEIQQLNHSISEPRIVPFDTDFVNSVNISQRVGEIDKWHHYFSPVMRYEKANVGVPNFDIVGVLDTVSEQEHAVAYLPKFADWTLSSMTSFYDANSIYNRKVITSDFFVQTLAGINKLSEAGICFFPIGMKSFKMSKEARPILADFSKSFFVTEFDKLAPNKKVAFLRDRLGELGKEKKYLNFPLYLLSQLSSCDFPISFQRLRLEQEEYLLDHPLATNVDVRAEVKFDYTGFSEEELSVHIVKNYTRIDVHYFQTFSEYIFTALPDKN